ncbi:MAG: ATPase [Burkholderiales bacterium 21-58-4]|nr:MAG: ATPase [Burkholderiales bacterium 21-58-4]
MAGNDPGIFFSAQAITGCPFLYQAVSHRKQRWPDDPAAHAYDAARIAADTRAKLIDAGVSFIAETVFSHPSKLELIRSAHDAGYVVALHVMLIPEGLAVERVRRRVRHGGHDVPEGKIRERHRRLWQLVADAIEIADTATVYDNSRLHGPRIVAQLTAGTVIGAPTWPAWASEKLFRRWPG